MMLNAVSGEDEVGAGAVELSSKQQLGVRNRSPNDLKTHDGLRGPPAPEPP